MCLFEGGAGVGFHTMFLLCLLSVLLYLAALCTFVLLCPVRPFGALPPFLNILFRHTIFSLWFMAIPYSESVCVFAGGAGWGFLPCFCLLLSPSSCTLRSCVCMCVCAWSVPVAPSFALLTYLLAIPLFRRGSWELPIARACARCVGGAGVGFHTMFLFELVSVFFHFAALCTFEYVCVVRSLCALLRIFNIIFCLFIVSPWSMAAPYLLRFFFVVYLAVLGAYGGIRGIYGCGLCLWACLMTCVVVRLPFLRAALSLGRSPSQHTWFSHLRMYGAVTYLFVIPLFSRGPWSCFLCLWFGVCPFVLFPSFFFF